MIIIKQALAEYNKIFTNNETINVISTSISNDILAITTEFRTQRSEILRLLIAFDIFECEFLTVSNKYNAKAYDRIALQVYKGERDKIRAYAESIGKSLNGYINDLIVSDMERNGVELRATATDEEPTAEWITMKRSSV